MNEKEEADFKLVRDCLKGKNSAYKQLYDLHSPWLFALCLRYSMDRDEAKDFLQDSFVVIFNKLNTFKFEGSFKGWMRRITVNTILTTLRKNKITFENPKNGLIDYDVPDLEFLQQLELEELKKIINSLSKGRKLVFTAYVIDGFSHKEIAEMLGISEGTSKSQLFDAKKEIQKAIEKNWMTAKKYSYGK